MKEALHPGSGTTTSPDRKKANLWGIQLVRSALSCTSTRGWMDTAMGVAFPQASGP